MKPPLSFALSRRALCASAALGAGLSFTGLAHAGKRQFRVMYDFPAGAAPESPAPCPPPRCGRG